MPRYLLYVAMCLLLTMGCAGPMARAERSFPPEISVNVLRKNVTTGALEPLGQEDLLASKEEAVLELHLKTPAFVMAALYSIAGASQELLVPDVATPLLANKRLYITIPRHAPPGVKENELRVFIIASLTPVGPLLRSLLRLPCGVQDRRGDPEPEKKTEPSTERSDGKNSSSSSGKPEEGGPRGGDAQAAACVGPGGLAAQVTVQALLLRSQ